MACAIVGAILLLPGHSTSVAGAGSPTPLFSLSALLSVAPDLPPISRRALITEAERIWRREGVTLQWVTTRPNEPPAAPLRVLVIERREAVRRAGAVEWTVGELVPHAGQRALAIASIAGATRVVVEASGLSFLRLDNPDLTSHRLGVVLGRAVAHEIGHYLLGTPTHAGSGLMRAAIGAREFADPAAGTFVLDDAAGAWLRAHVRMASGGEVALPSSGFNYVAP